jgi:hypothetical protein
MSRGVIRQHMIGRRWTVWRSDCTGKKLEILKGICRQLRVSTAGNKQDIINRLKTQDADLVLDALSSVESLIPSRLPVKSSWLIATSTNLKTGSEPESASTHGSAEVPECAKVKAGAMEMMHAKKSMSEH